ncbi:MAG: hypothetical protein ISR50_14340 [Alphaproteobacteria bacterium]|nr:hypothetical protein [Alphaproteobacteria bacterium]
MRRPVQKVALQAGDRLEKVGMPGQVWVVEHLVKPTGQQPHAVIVYDKNDGETRMLAQSVLCDEARYRRLEKQSG